MFPYWIFPYLHNYSSKDLQGQKSHSTGFCTLVVCSQYNFRCAHFNRPVLCGIVHHSISLELVAIDSDSATVHSNDNNWLSVMGDYDFTYSYVAWVW